MIGIARNRNTTWSWFEALTYLPQGILEVMSFGYLSTDNYKIVRNYDPWWECILFLMSNFVIVLSFGYLDIDWEQKL